eukprot:2908169-Karenia_brevis.AAC.1
MIQYINSAMNIANTWFASSMVSVLLIIKDGNIDDAPMGMFPIPTRCFADRAKGMIHVKPRDHHRPSFPCADTAVSKGA